MCRALFPEFYSPVLESYDVNVSPDKRTILVHSEANLISALKVRLLFCPFCLLRTHLFRLRLLLKSIFRRPGPPLISVTPKVVRRHKPKHY